MPWPTLNSAGPIWSKKIKGPDHLPHPGRQCTANLEASKIAGAGNNHGFD
jgi:hypothetical protein